MALNQSGARVKGVVREHYAERARKASREVDGGGAGSGTACCAPSPIYSPLELMSIPLGAQAASAGCGNPTALAGLKEGEVVLDLGSGGGIDCFLAARAVGKAGLVLGVDMTHEMVGLAKANARKLKAANVDFFLGELESLPFREGTVDVIISNCVINLSPDKDAVFREAFRVLKPGGRLHVSDILAGRELPQSVSENPGEWSACVAGADLIEVFLARMGRAGFAEVAIREAMPLSREDLVASQMVSAKVEGVKPA